MYIYIYVYIYMYIYMFIYVHIDFKYPRYPNDFGPFPLNRTVTDVRSWISRTSHRSHLHRTSIQMWLGIPHLNGHPPFVLRFVAEGPAYACASPNAQIFECIRWLHQPLIAAFVVETHLDRHLTRPKPGCANPFSTSGSVHYLAKEQALIMIASDWCYSFIHPRKFRKVRIPIPSVPVFVSATFCTIACHL